MIVLKDVSFQYEGCEEGVHGIDLTVCDGDCVVLTGPSGGGKTTLTRLLNGLAPSYYQGTKKGDLWINYTEIASLPAWKIGQEIGSVFQDPKSQFFSSELAGEVAFACENYGMAKQEIRKRTDEAIASMGLETLRARPLDVLSSGEKQRVAVASVYALRSHTYVCDEPTANLGQRGSYKACGHTSEIERRGKHPDYSGAPAGMAKRYRRPFRLCFRRNHPVGKNAGADEGTFRGRTKAVRSAGSHGNRGFPAGGSCKRREEHFFCRNLTCRRKKLLIFENLNLSLPAGKITALTGRNGAGKTTLAMVLAGLQKQSGGEIYIGGKKLPAGKRRKVVWYSSNDTGTQFFTTSVTEELLLHSDASSGRLEHARTLLKTLGLYAYKDTHPAALSGGQKQRLSIACGLLSGREILLFDEPTSGWTGETCEKSLPY